MFELVGIKGDSVRIRAGLVLIDVKVVNSNGKNIVRLPYGVFVDNFKVLVAMVLEAYEIESNGEIKANDETEVYNRK